MQSRSFWVAVCLAVMAGLTFGFGATALPVTATNKASAPGDFFTSLTVLHIQLEISSADMDLLRNTSWRDGSDRPTVKAVVKEGNTVYTNVAVHLKGSAGSFRPVDYNPCFTLNFQKFVPGQTFHGLHKISLNNSVQDESFLTEKISRELFEAAGVPAARAGHAIVSLNNRHLGLHVVTEGFNKQFLRRYFKNTAGNLYDGGFVQDINAPLVVNSGDNPQAHSGLNALIEAVREPDETNRLVRLEKALDMDRFLSFIAMEVMLCHWDGYAMNHNNWRIFHDQETQRMVFFPHGMDQMFGVQRTTPECPILPRLRGAVAVALLRTQEGQRRYFDRMSQLYTRVFKADAILKRVDELAAAIRPAIEETNPAGMAHFEAEVRWLKARITQRNASLKRQLQSIAKR